MSEYSIFIVLKTERLSFKEGFHLEGVTSWWQEARAVQLVSCWHGGHQFGDVADVPDMLRALCGWQINVIQRETSLWGILSSYAFKNHSCLACHIQIDVMQLPGAHDTSCKESSENVCRSLIHVWGVKCLSLWPDFSLCYINWLYNRLYHLEIEKILLNTFSVDKILEFTKTRWPDFTHRCFSL